MKKEKTMIRLDKLLSDCENLTRTEAARLIKAGKVTVEGRLVKDPGEKILPKEQAVTLSGEPVLFEETVWFMLHKPAGYLSVTEDGKYPSVLKLLPEKNRKGLFPVGRLDVDTEGLLLLTNDGLLSHKLLSPRYHVKKTYYLETDKELPADAKERFLKGLDLGDFTAKEAVYEPLTKTSGKLTITEGKYHQVKRMVEALGAKVTYLKRLTFGPLALPEDLPLSGVRKLTEEEIAMLSAPVAPQKGEPCD